MKRKEKRRKKKIASTYNKLCLFFCAKYLHFWNKIRLKKLISIFGTKFAFPIFGTKSTPFVKKIRQFWSYSFGKKLTQPYFCRQNVQTGSSLSHSHSLAFYCIRFVFWEMLFCFRISVLMMKTVVFETST